MVLPISSGLRRRLPPHSACRFSAHFQHARRRLTSPSHGLENSIRWLIKSNLRLVVFGRFATPRADSCWVIGSIYPIDPTVAKKRSRFGREKVPSRAASSLDHAIKAVLICLCISRTDLLRQAVGSPPLIRSLVPSLMTRYGMPYIFEDTTGRLTGSEFIDIHDRLRFTVRCTAHDTCHTSYMIYNTSPNVFQSAIPRPLVALDFGANNTLGSISVASMPMPMRKYLTKHAMGSSKVRRFVGSDGQIYQWARRTQPNQEWTCTNANNYVIASYSLKAAGEPEYSNSSGCILEIAEQFGSLAAEMIASLWIMRHIAAYDLV